MKTTILITIFVLFSLLTFSQSKFYTGFEVGPKNEPNKVTVGKITGTGNDIGFYDDNGVLLSPVNPDTVNIRSVAVMKPDTNNITTGSYTSRYDFKNEPTRDNFLKIWQGYGSTLKMIPACIPYFYEVQTMSDNNAHWSVCYTADTVTITGFRYVMQTAGNFTEDNTNGIALYSYSAGVATYLRATANDANIWKATAFTPTQVALTAPITIPPGYYLINALYNNSAQVAAPVIQAYFGGALTMSNLGMGVNISAKSSGQNTFPTPYTMSGASNNLYIFGILCY